MKRLREIIRNKYGQTVLEVALLFPFFLFLVFGFYFLSLFLTEAHVARYAAFMAARSYQVYGGQSLPQGKKVYQSVAEDIITGAMPYIERESISIEVDSRSAALNSGFFEREEWQKLHKDFSLSEVNVPGDVEAIVSYVDDNIFVPRFGVMKLKFKHSRALPFSDVIFSQQAIAPYRLEERVPGDLGR